MSKFGKPISQPQLGLPTALEPDTLVDKSNALGSGLCNDKTGFPHEANNALRCLNGLLSLHDVSLQARAKFYERFISVDKPQQRVALWIPRDRPFVENKNGQIHQTWTLEDKLRPVESDEEVRSMVENLDDFLRNNAEEFEASPDSLDEKEMLERAVQLAKESHPAERFRR